MPMGATINARCGECDHVWTVAHPPMQLDRAAKLMKAARCPKACKGKVFLA